MHRTLIALTFLALAIAGGAAVAAQDQDACQSIEPEPEKGPIQGLVWATTVRTDPNGSAKSLELPILYFDGETWQCVVAIDASPQGKWLNAQVGDSWVTKLEKADG
jgi:hypothetical protein